ncbi:MAG: hypothetical protein KAR05_04245 [Candidatus Omnitrophica bacterium]|nr:hypothetical protein [Candidatus Omnitrophota bacterium]
MKRALFIIVGLLFFLLFFVMNTTWLLDLWTPLIFEKQFRGFTLQSYNFEGQSYQFPHSIKIKNGKFVIVHKRKVYNAEFQEMTLYDVFNSLLSTHQIKFSIKGLDINWEGGSLKGMEPKLVLAFEDFIFKKVNGIVSTKEFTFGPYVATNIYARIKGDKTQIQIFEITADCYEGKMQGQVMVSTEPYLNYIIWFKNDNMNPLRLVDIYSDIFKNVDGKVTGALRIGGDASRLNILVLNLEMSKNAKLDKALLLALKNVANEREAREIDAILQTHDVLVADEAYVQLRSDKGNNLNVILGISSRQDNFYFKKVVPSCYEDILPVLLKK